MMRTEPTFQELFTPKLVTVLREGYDLPRFRADAIAGLTVAIVALPLSMAIAIASGAGPERGLYTAIVGGFLVSLLGGSRFQIGGPAGAFIVLIAAIIERHGFDGLLLATIVAGFIMMAIGFLRLGAYIQYIPHPVTVGFTAGIGVIIIASQMRELFGLTLAGAEPAAFLPKIAALWAAAGTSNVMALVLGAAGVAAIVVLRRFYPRFPGLLLVVVLGGLVTWLFALPVETIGSRFGGVPQSLPPPALPWPGWQKLVDVLPDALAIALLGSIESLLSAVVADGMTGRRHRSNCELVAQGVANIFSAIFGGLCATGTIARTATNIRAGAVGPVAGMLHAVFLLLMMILAAPLMRHVPLAILASVLLVVAWNMIEMESIRHFLRHSRGDATVLAATFALTVLRDLTEGIAVGVVLGSFLFMHRMAAIVAVRTGETMIEQDRADEAGAARTPYDARESSDRDTVVYHLSGPLFFGTAASVGSVLERIGAQPKRFVLDLSGVPFADSAAALSLHAFATKMTRHGARVALTGVSPTVREVLQRHGLDSPLVSYADGPGEPRRADAPATAA